MLVVTVGVAKASVSHPKVLLSHVAKARMIRRSRIQVRNQLAYHLRKGAIAVLLKVPTTNAPSAAFGMGLSEGCPLDDRRMITEGNDDLADLTQRFPNEDFTARVGVRKNVDRPILIEREFEDFQNSE